MLHPLEPPNTYKRLVFARMFVVLPMRTSLEPLPFVPAQIGLVAKSPETSVVTGTMPTAAVLVMPPPPPLGTAHVPLAFKNLPAAASPDAGAGTAPLVPPEPESPTMVTY